VDALFFNTASARTRESARLPC